MSHTSTSVVRNDLEMEPSFKASRQRASFAFRPCLRSRIVLFGLILLLAFALRLWGLGAHGLWYDEGLEYRAAAGPLVQLLPRVKSILQDPPLYSLLLHFWMYVSRSEFYLRFFSASLSVLTVLGAMVAAQRIGGWSAGLTAGLVMSVLPGEIRYAGEIGQYALMECTLVWSLVALLSISRTPGWRQYLGWGALAAVATYSYYGAVFTLAASFGLNALLELRARGRSSLFRGVGMVSTYCLIITPLVLFFLPSQFGRGPVANALHVTFGSLPDEANKLLTSSEQLAAFQLTGAPFSQIPTWIPALTVVAGLLLVPLSIAQAGWLAQRWFFWLAGIWALYYIASRLGMFPYGFRYSLILTPSLVPAVAAAIALAFRRRHVRVLAAVALSAMLVLCLLSLPKRTYRTLLFPAAPAWAWPETEEMGPVTRFWLEHRTSGQPTYVYFWAASSLPYYLKSYQDRHPGFTWDQTCLTETSFASCPGENLYVGTDIRRLSPGQKLEAIVGALPSRPKEFWFLYSFIQPGLDKVVLDSLRPLYHVANQFETTNSAAYLLQANQ